MVPSKKNQLQQKICDDDVSVKKDLDEIIKRTEEQNKALSKILKINNNRLLIKDKAQLMPEIKNIIKKVEEQNKALGKIIKDGNINYK